MLATTEGATGLGPALVTAGGVVVTAVCALVGVLFTRSRRDSSSDEQLIIVNLASTLAAERDARVAAEAQRDGLRAQLDACIDRERRRHR